jgi:hypothetical protein
MVRAADIDAARFGWMADVNTDYEPTLEHLKAVYCINEGYEL